MKICSSDSVEARPVEMEGAEGVRMRLLVNTDDGAPTFLMRQFHVAPGGHTPRHEHDWEHECYILSGEGSVLTPDGSRPIATGDCLLIPPGEVHQFSSTGDEELRFLCLVPK